MTQDGEMRSLLRRALRLERAGRVSEAEAAYTQLLSRWPDQPDSWYNLALLQRRAGRFTAALDSYRQALEHGVTAPEEVHLNRGVIYSDCLRQDAAAETELRAALALNPDYVPALLNLANLREDFGNRDAALALYERILVLQPNYHEALARYAGLCDVDGPDDALIARLRQAIAQPGVPAGERASLGFALGKILDRCAAYDLAFDAYALANRHSRDSAAPGRVLYDRLQHESLVDRLIETFARDRPARSDATETAPIFICGMFRSGSTLAQQVLAAHSRVTSGGEMDLLPTMVRTRLNPFPETLAVATPQQLGLLANSYLQAQSLLFPGADLVTDKRPDNFLYIGLIKSLFPNARIVHTSRDPLDNCLSIFFLHLDHSMGYALDLMDTAHYYVQYRRLMAHWHSLYAADIFDLDYDTLVREPRPQLERVLSFCGLEWEEGCLSFGTVANAVKTASVWQVREPLYQRSSGRWQNYAAHLVSLRDYLRRATSGADWPGSNPL